MTDQKELNIDNIVSEILESDIVVEHRTVPERGQFFTWYRENTNFYFKVRTAIHVRTDDGVKIMASDRRDDYLRILIQASRKGYIDIAEIRKVDHENRCSKCSGIGFIPGYEHVQNGVCFKCGGTGVGG